MRTNYLFLPLAFLLLLNSNTNANEPVTLVSNDGQEFIVREEVAKQSEMLEGRIKLNGTEKPAKLEEINGETLAQIVAILNGVHEKQSDSDIVAFLRESLPADNSSALGSVLRAVDFLQFRKTIVLNTLIDSFGKAIFEHNLSDIKGIFEEKEPAHQKAVYTQYLNNTLPHNLPESLQHKIIERGIRGVDRIFVDSTPRRRVNAINSINSTSHPLAVAQVIAYIAEYNVPSEKQLPDLLRNVLKEWLGDDFASKIHFGPMPIEWAIWPGHCPLPSDANYNMYSDNAPADRFIDNGDGTLTDVCTRLTWEKAPSLLRALDWEASVKHCEDMNPKPSNKRRKTDQGVGENSSQMAWRAPTRIELQSIVNYSVANPTINAIFSEGNERYGSSTSNADAHTSAWTVNFEQGSVVRINKTEGIRMRCVKGERGGLPSIGAKPHYDYQNKSVTVRDNFTGAVWQRTLADMRVVLPAAQNYCKELQLEGGGWMLPTVKTLSTLVDVSAHSPRIDSDALPMPMPHWDLSTDGFLSSSSRVVWFHSGEVLSYPGALTLAVRCVR